MSADIEHQKDNTHSWFRADSCNGNWMTFAARCRIGLSLGGVGEGRNHCEPRFTGPHLDSQVGARLHELTGIELEANCGLDTSHALGEWHGVSVLHPP
jgi:hypothetical protein